MKKPLRLLCLLALTVPVFLGVLAGVAHAQTTNPPACGGKISSSVSAGDPCGDSTGNAKRHPRPRQGHPRRQQAVADAGRQEQDRDQHRLDARHRLPRHVHAGRLRARRDRLLPQEERRARHDDELHDLRDRRHRLLDGGLRLHVRRRRPHRPARRHQSAQPHVHCARVGTVRPQGLRRHAHL